MTRLVIPAALLALLAAVPTAAHAHADADGAQGARPGSTGTVPIAIAHGCGGESGALRKVDRVAVLVPRSFTAVRPLAARGWSASASRVGDGTRVEWRATAGGALSPRFRIAVRFPTASGTYPLPTVQYCGRDSIAWIQRGAGAERPAPTVAVR